MRKLAVAFLALISVVTGVALAADAKAGADIYNKTCKGCHGADGAAPNEGLAKMMNVTIPTLASPEFQASKSDADIKTAITMGKGKMPAQKSVAAESVDDVVAYIRSLKK